MTHGASFFDSSPLSVIMVQPGTPACLFLFGWFYLLPDGDLVLLFFLLLGSFLPDSEFGGLMCVWLI